MKWVPRLVVATREEMRLRRFQPHPGQRGAHREDCFESLRRALRHAEAHLDSSQQEEPLNRLLVGGGTGLLEERPRVLQPAGSEEEPAGLHVGETVQWSDRSGSRIRLRARREQKRTPDQCGTRKSRENEQSALLRLLASEIAYIHRVGASGLLLSLRRRPPPHRVRRNVRSWVP